MDKIGERVKKLINKSPFSINDVAIKIGTSNQNLYKILRKDSIESRYLEQIADVLNISIMQFFVDEKYFKLEKEAGYKDPTDLETYLINLYQSQFYLFLKFIELLDLDKAKVLIEKEIGPIYFTKSFRMSDLWRFFLFEENEKDYSFKLGTCLDPAKLREHSSIDLKQYKEKIGRDKQKPG